MHFDDIYINLEKGNFLKADKLALEFYKKNIKKDTVAELLVSIAIEAGDVVLAKERIKLLTEFPVSAYRLFLFARVFYMEKDYWQSLTYLEQAVEDELLENISGQVKEKIYNLLGQCYRFYGYPDRAAECYYKAFEAVDLKQLKIIEYSNYLFNLHYLDISEQDYFLAHKDYDKLFSDIKQFKHKKRIKKHHEKIRVGYISPDFRNHVVLRFTYVMLTAYNKEKFEVYCYSTGKEDEVRFMDILPNILKECDIDEIRLYTRDNQDPKKIKTYIFNGIARDKQQIITKETIAKMPVFTIPTTTTGYAPITQVNKSAKIRFSYQLRLDTYETLWEFFQYFKRQGFKKYEWTSLFNVQDKESDYEGISSSRELFDKFMVDNNFEVYSFSQKNDIEYAVNQEAYRYCRENLGYQENVGMLHYCEWKEKGKDDKGQFVYIRFCCEYNDTDRNYRYVKLLYRFYKSGLCILDKVLDDGLEYL